MRLQPFLKDRRFAIQRRTYRLMAGSSQLGRFEHAVSGQKSCHRGRLEATGGTNGGHAVDGGSR